MEAQKKSYVNVIKVKTITEHRTSHYLLCELGRVSVSSETLSSSDSLPSGVFLKPVFLTLAGLLKLVWLLKETAEGRLSLGMAEGLSKEGLDMPSGPPGTAP